MFSLNTIPIFEKLKDSNRILIAGAGGGFDIYAGIPFILNLLEQGKEVVISNFAFTALSQTTASEEFPFCYSIRSNDRDLSQRGYFPEKYLKQWMESRDINVPVYAFEGVGVKPLREAYQYLIAQHEIDTVLLVDGGTDSLMFGDEEGLGTPIEDGCSMAAVFQTEIEKQYLVCLGFGVDHYHGVSHYRFLENLTELSREGGFLGSFHLVKEMPEAQAYIEAVNFANARMASMESIVSNSIISALEGQYGNYHRTRRTQGSKLWISPLMSIYWAFDLKKVVPKIKYYDLIKDVHTMREFAGKLATYRSSLEDYKRSKQIPI